MIKPHTGTERLVKSLKHLQDVESLAGSKPEDVVGFLTHIEDRFHKTGSVLETAESLSIKPRTLIALLASPLSETLAPDDPRRLGAMFERNKNNTLCLTRAVEDEDKELLFRCAEQLGLKTTKHNLHVTLAYSRKAVDWTQEVFQPERSSLSLSVKGWRPERWNDIIVLTGPQDTLTTRWEHLVKAGASWDHEHHRPHITLGPDPGGQVDLSQATNLPRTLRFQPELRETTEGEKDIHTRTDLLNAIKEQHGNSKTLFVLSRVLQGQATEHAAFTAAEKMALELMSKQDSMGPLLLKEAIKGGVSQHGQHMVSRGRQTQPDTSR